MGGLVKKGGGEGWGTLVDDVLNSMKTKYKPFLTCSLDKTVAIIHIRQLRSNRH
jgi:hypothetical protein